MVRWRSNFNSGGGGGDERLAHERGGEARRLTYRGVNFGFGFT